MLSGTPTERQWKEAPMTRVTETRDHLIDQLRETTDPEQLELITRKLEVLKDLDGA